MPPDIQHSDVQEYLTQCKQLVKAGQWHLEPRNLRTITVLGLTINDIRDYLLRLKMTDFCKVEPDRDTTRPGDLWLFLFDEPGSILDYYVKLNLHPRLIHVSVISFHPPESRLRRRFQ